MKPLLFGLLLGLAWVPEVRALPNSIGGFIARADSPLNGVDLTPQLTGGDLWLGKVALPGEWQDGGKVATASVSHLLARPKLFGREVLLLRATQRDGRLETLEATFVDAGSYFGYFQEPMAANLSQREKREEMQARMAEKQKEFTTLYHETETSLQAAISQALGVQPKADKVGRTRGLRAEPQLWANDHLAVRLLEGPDRLIRVSLSRPGELDADWFDRSLAGETPRDRLARLAAGVEKEDDGTVLIPEIRPIPQGYKPYCGLNTLAMAARQFGMHLDEDWLACAGGFRNTGSADGSNMVRLYHAVAAEAGLGLDRQNRFDPGAARRALDAGLPVIVWRRFSWDRNELHTNFMREFARNPAATLPDPGDTAERSSWPGKDAPLHASVLTGYHAGRHEFLFLESWTGKDTPRRMREEELVATTYLSFVFKP